MRRVILLGIVLCVCLSNGFCGYPRPYIFGINPTWGVWVGQDPDYYDPAMMDMMMNAGCTIQRSGFDWCIMEPSPGVYVWDEYDRRVDMSLARGIQWLGLICTSPGWANGTGQGDIYPPLEEYAEEFMNFVRALAEHYRGRVTYYEFWNEEDVCGWKPAPDVDEYTRWLKRCYQALKEGDPDAKLSVGGLLGRDMGFLRGIYALGGGPYFDAVAIHPYPSDTQGTPWIDTKMIEDVRQTMVDHGDADKPIWITEYGWEIHSVPPDLQEQYLRNTLNTLMSGEYSYVTVATYHTISDFDPSGGCKMGLCDINLNPRPAYYAFQEIATQPSPVVWNVQAINVTMDSATIVWTTDIPATSRVEYGLTTSYGEMTPLYEELVTEHTVILDGLQSGTTYHYRVRSSAPGYGENISPDFTFQTKRLPNPELLNGGFEAGDLTGWYSWGRVDGVQAGPWFAGITPHSGNYFFGSAANWDRKNGGIYQTIATTPGGEYEVSSWIRTYYTGGSAYDVTCQIGVDISGGYDPYSSAVVWTESTPSPNVWSYLAMRVVATGNMMTVFLKHNQGAVEWNITCFDDVSVQLTNTISVTTPEGFIKEGWNLISLPLIPSSDNPDEIFADLAAAGNSIHFNLYKYDGTEYLLYPVDFQTLSYNEPVWLYVTNPVQNTVDGLRKADDAVLDLPQGWSLIGLPFPEPVLWADCSLNLSGVVKSVAEAVEANWIQGCVFTFSPDVGYMPVYITDSGAALEPWYGYWVYVFVDGVQLIIPAP